MLRGNFMDSFHVRALGVALPVLVLSLVATASSQDTGPLPPSQNSPAPAATPSPATAPAAASSPAPAVAPVPATPAGASSKAATINVPGGTHIPLVLHNAVSTRSARPGDPVYFETLFPVMVDGKVVIPAGSYVSGEVSEAKRPGRVKGRAELGVRLTTMILPNTYMVNLAAAPSNAGTGGGEKADKEGTIKGDSDKASDAGTVIRATEAGTAIGAGVGAAAGHIGQGVGIGAGAGAVAGLAAVLLSRGPEAEMPRGTTLE